MSISGLLAQNNVLEEVNIYVAAKEYDKIVQLLENNNDTHQPIELKNHLGEAYANLEEWDKAISIFEELKNNQPKSAKYWFNYGGVLAMKAQNSNRFTALTLIGRIKRSFIEAAEIDAKHVDSRWALVDVYLSLPGILGGSVSKARKYAEELKNISILDGYLALGYVDEYDGEHEKAKKNYLSALNYIDDLNEIERNQIRYQIAKICGDYGIRVDEGIDHMQKFIENYSVKDGVTMEWIYYRLARLYRQKMDKKTASKFIQQALAMNAEFELAIEERDRIAVM